METPYFNALISQFDKKDQPLVLSMIYAMMTNTRLAKQIIIQCESPSGKTCLVNLIHDLMAVKPAYIVESKAFWGSNLVEQRSNQSGVACWTQDDGSNNWLKDKTQTVFQKPVISLTPTPTMLNRLHYLAPTKTLELRKIHRLGQPTICFKEWLAPILIITWKDLNVNPTHFHTIRMRKLEHVDQDFWTHISNEVPFILENFKMEA